MIKQARETIKFEVKRDCKLWADGIQECDAPYLQLGQRYMREALAEVQRLERENEGLKLQLEETAVDPCYFEHRIEQARTEAARECLEIMGHHLIPSNYKTLKNAVLKHFGIEGE